VGEGATPFTWNFESKWTRWSEIAVSGQCEHFTLLLNYVTDMTCHRVILSPNWLVTDLICHWFDQYCSVFFSSWLLRLQDPMASKLGIMKWRCVLYIIFVVFVSVVRIRVTVTFTLVVLGLKGLIDSVLKLWIEWVFSLLTLNLQW